MDNFISSLIPIIAIIFSFGVPAIIIVLLARMSHQRKIELIRRGLDPNVNAITYPGKRSLFWGIMLTAFGIAGCVVAIIFETPPLGNTSLMVIAGGIAMLIYYKATASGRERGKKLYEKTYPNKAI